MKATREMIHGWREFVSRHRIMNSMMLFEHSDEEIIASCNGIGPDRWPEAVRNVIDFLNPCFILPSVIHDLSFTYDNDGTAEKFHHHNKIFEVNCSLMSKYSYGWWNPMRYVYLHKAKKFGMLLDDFGWKAWEDAYKIKSSA